MAHTTRCYSLIQKHFIQFFSCVFAFQCYVSTKKINTSTRGQVTKYHLVQPIVFSKVRPIIMRRIFCIIKRRQDGKCHFCNLLFSKKDVLVSCGYRRNYYHKSCARKLHIIQDNNSLFLSQTYAFPINIMSLQRKKAYKFYFSTSFSINETGGEWNGQ